jgi:hypothetical protein
MKPLFAEICEESACVRASLVAALWFLMLRLIADLDGAVASFVRGKNRDYKSLVVSFKRSLFFEFLCVFFLGFGNFPLQGGHRVVEERVFGDSWGLRWEVGRSMRET